MTNPIEKSQNIYVIDVETTGPNIFVNDVLYIYMAPLFSEKPDLELFIKYDDRNLEWGSVASKYFKAYSSEWRAKSVAFDSAWEVFVNYVENKIGAKEIILAGHNVSFDYSFLKKLAYLNNSEMPKKISHRLFDVHSVLFYYYLKGIVPKSALSSLGSIKYFGLDYSSDKRHSAKEDANATRNIIMNLLNLNELEFFSSEQ